MIDDKIAEGSLPFFSVVVPVYNKEPHIARAINSILNQTFQDFELIIVCDPSTDNSNAEVAKFTDPRIRVFHRDEPGPGGYAARNLGIKEAKAEWVAFLDADDEWHASHLDNASTMINKFPSCNMFSSGWRISRGYGIKSNSFTISYCASNHIYLTLVEFLREMANKRPPIWTGVAVIRRELLLRAKGFPISCRRGGDVALWLGCMIITKYMIVVPKPTATYDNVVSGVTKITCSGVSNNCLLMYAKKFIASESITPIEKKILKAMSNRFFFGGLRSRLIRREAKLSDAKYFYPMVSIKQTATFCMYILLLIIPSSVAKAILTSEEKVKYAINHYLINRSNL